NGKQGSQQGTQQGSEQDQQDNRQDRQDNRQSGRSGEQQREQVAQALDAVNRALENMRSASNGGNPQAGADAAHQAGRDLRQALQRIDQREPSRLDEELQRFAERANAMAGDQRRIEDELHEALAQDQRGSRPSPYGSIEQRQAQQLVQKKQQMAKDLTQL